MYSFNDISILIVDDEPEFLDVMHKRLNKRGFTVYTSNTGGDAIQKLRENNFAIAVLDLKMQDMDGLEILKIFKKMVPELPVVMLTGHGSEEAAREGMALGAFDYLIKPCDFDNLVQVLNSAMNGDGSTAGEDREGGK
ncbi:MAG: response regulator [Thermodesulfobacteriota bacterium]